MKKRSARKKQSPHQRFMKKVKKQENGCWLWIGAKDGSGYGKFLGHSKVMTPHKFSYEEHKGHAVPDGQLVRHTCDNPLCVNPDHLELGTYTQNAKDRWSRTGKTLPAAESIKRTIMKVLPNTTDSQLAAALKALGLS